MTPPDTCVSCGSDLDDNYGGVGPDGPLCADCWNQPPAEEIDDTVKKTLDTDIDSEVE